jgi:hypothetical protein
MAENKKSFVLYCDLLNTVEGLTDKEGGLLLKHILRYVNDKNPVTDNKIIKIAFEPIKQQLKRDLVKYERIREKNSHNAKIRWDAKNATASERMPNDAKHADNGIDTVTDNDTDIVKKRERAFSPPAKEDVILVMSEKLDEFTAMGEAEKFMNHYQSNGWKVSKNKMKDWKAAVRNWISRMKNFKHGTYKQAPNDKNSGVGKLFSNIDAAVAAGATSNQG